MTFSASHPNWIFDDTPIPDPRGRGEVAVQFIRAMRHPKSQAPGRAFELPLWQERIVRRIYGPTHADGRRLVRTVVILLPRGNRKTSLGAALGLLHTVGPAKSLKGEAIFAASDRKQARIAYDEATGILNMVADVGEKVRILESRNRFEDRATEACLEAISADAGTQHGRTPRFALLDELHAWKKRDLWDVIQTGLVKVPGSLQVVITTAGRGTENVAYEIVDYARKVARGEIDDADGSDGNYLRRFLGSGKADIHITGLSGQFSDKLATMLASAPEAVRAATKINSGFRSVERQAELYAAAVAKYGSEAAARKWVAPPGRSQHNHGSAADLGFGTPEAEQWFHANAGRFGLRFRMGHEPWHIEDDGANTARPGPAGEADPWGGIRGGADGLTVAQEALAKQTDALNDRYQRLGEIGVNTFRSIADAMADGKITTQEWLQIALNLLQQLASLPALPGPDGKMAGGGGLGALVGGVLKLIPGFATGTPSAPGGLARINERGGEIVNLPRGAQVIPHDLSRQMTRSRPRERRRMPSFSPTYQIDARGSTMTEGEFRQLARQENMRALSDYHQSMVSGGFGEMQRRFVAQKG